MPRIWIGSAGLLCTILEARKASRCIGFGFMSGFGVLQVLGFKGFALATPDRYKP